MKGKLIVFEGGDASGKETQTNALVSRLQENGHNVKKISYPNYNSNSSSLIKMYLNGDFGEDPSSINPYAASLFYTVDRYASYKTDWEEFYNEGGIIIADRYVTSNMIHQAAKINSESSRKQYLNWLWNLEFDLVGLPTPDMVFFLDVPPTMSRLLIEQRTSKISGNNGKDIHEESSSHLEDVYKNAIQIVEEYGWIRVECIYDKKLRSIEDIHMEVYNQVSKIISRI